MSKEKGWLVSINTGEGGVPKNPRVGEVFLNQEGLEGDQQGHEKHRKLERALSVLSIELLDYFQSLGFPVAPGLMAENLTVFGVDLCDLEPGDRLSFDNGVLLSVSSQRKPCFQLNPIKEGLEQAAVGRTGVMCEVLKPGVLKQGLAFSVERKN